MNRSPPLRVRHKVSTTRAHHVDELKLAAFEYYLDESDPDVVVLRRQDGSFVAAFSADGATKEGIVEAAREDYRALVGQYVRSYSPAVEEERF
jgi:hypothetical protein